MARSEVCAVFRLSLRAIARWSDDDPALVLFGNIRIFYKSETQRPDVKGDGLVVVMNNNGKKTDKLIHVETWGGLRHSVLRNENEFNPGYFADNGRAMVGRGDRQYLA
jgi:hypothetical protein